MNDALEPRGLPMARYDFRGTVAVVTGAAAGIGAAIARRLRADGATVIAWDLSERGSEADDFHRVDVTDPDTLRAATASALARWGRIDCLVNNAGFAGPTMPLDAYDPKTWQQIIDVNLTGVFHFTMTPAPNFAGLRRSPIQQVYQ